MSKVIIGVWPNLSIEVSHQGDDPLDIFKELSFWDSIPHECPVRISAEEICGTALHFTYRAPIAKQGPKKGKVFPYAGLQCTGNPAHECQFSKRNDGTGLFIREGNRQDGKPNWRLAFIQREEEEEYDHGSHNNERESHAETISGVVSDVDKQVNALLDMGKEKGYANEKALNQNCRHLYSKEIRQLTRNEAAEYYKTLHAM